ncbi:hypothetical protein [Paenibacillus sp. YIM B09110]|uniref:hypothetical protein n=1 Tax=Paenibacillus sp. YIM B09110 TaxID=3126102 RepID=UPI00301B87FE
MTASVLVIFPDGDWQQFSPLYQQLLLGYTSQHRTYIVTDRAATDYPAHAVLIPLEQLHTIPWNTAVIIVMNPYWLHTALAWSPHRIIVLDHFPIEAESALLSKCRKLLCAAGHLVITNNELYYLEQSFQREDVFLLDGSDEVSDLFARQAFSWTIGDYMARPLVRLQQRFIAERYAKSIKSKLENSASEPLNASELFFHAVFRYLADDLSKSEEELLQAFQLAILEGNKDALTDYYRFLSAIQLKSGDTWSAIRSYSYSAVTDEDRQKAYLMDDWLQEGKETLAKALLYRLNDDYRQAVPLLEPQASSEPVASKLLIEAYVQIGRLGAAMEHMEKLSIRSIEEQQQYELLHGTYLMMLQGRRHEAIHAWLAAAESRVEAIGSILELSELDNAIRKLAGAGAEASTEAESRGE